MTLEHFNILLADDDTDDCIFFQKALDELQISNNLTIVNDGDQLMKYLTTDLKQLPDVLFLDLNMPRKSGFECLSEIKDNERLKHICLVVFTISFPCNTIYEKELIIRLRKMGALHYIIKPENFEKLKDAISESLIIVTEKILSKRYENYSLLIQKNLS